MKARTAAREVRSPLPGARLATIVTMRPVSFDRTVPRAHLLLILVLVTLLSGCGLNVVRELIVAPTVITLSAAVEAQTVAVGYSGPAGSTLTVSANVSHEWLSVTPATVAIPAGATARVTIRAATAAVDRVSTGTVRFSGVGVQDVIVTVALTPGCFIDPFAPLAAVTGAATPTSHGLDHVPGELLVSYRAFPADRAALGATDVAARAGTALAVAAAAGVEVLRLGHAGEHDLVAAPGGDLERAIVRLRSDPRVEHVSRNYLVHRLAVSGAHYDAQWYLDGFGAETAWQVGDAAGPGAHVVVAIVDDGLNVDHVDLRDKVLPGRDVYCDDHDVRALSDHGTHVAGIAAAGGGAGGVVAGVAPGMRARLLPVKVFPDDIDMGGTLDTVIRGMRWAAGLGSDDGAAATSHVADVINLSLGFGTSLSSSAVSLLQATVDAIHARGIVMVAASGNTGANSGVTYPARLANVIAVGSVDWELTRSTFSTYGSGLDLVAPGGTAPAAASSDPVCLSGGAISGRHGMIGAAAGGERAVACLAGTSMAAPYVAGTAALLIAHDAAYRGDPQAVYDRLALTAHRPAGYDAAQYGRGVVCLDAVLDPGAAPCGGR
jgi:hypothetical protein